MPTGLTPLPGQFAMKDLRGLYESILQKEPDRTNFQKKMLKLGFLKRLEKLCTGGAHKAPFVNAFDREQCNQLLKQGIGYV
jgi:hypothetical protein